VKESHRRIDGGIEGAIFMGWKIRGVGKPGIHVAWIDQPIYDNG
jgi:hypothetical protein